MSRVAAAFRLLGSSLPRLAAEGVAIQLASAQVAARLALQSASFEQAALLHSASSSFRAPITASLQHTDAAPSTSQRSGAALGWMQQGSVQGCQVRGMFIQTQPTPNPNSLMFVPGKTVLESGSHQFSNARDGMNSPLAKKLFAIDGVASVFYGSDFVTVSKKEEYSWSVLKPDVFAAIMDFYSSGEPLFYDTEHRASSDTAINEDDSEIVAMIKELLETRIKPSVQEDGGDIAFVGFEEDTGTVLVKLQGSCSTCPSSTVTLKGGIETMLKHYIPEVLQVIEAPPDEGDLEGMKEFNELDKKLEDATATNFSKPATAALAKEENPMAALLSN